MLQNLHDCSAVTTNRTIRVVVELGAPRAGNSGNEAKVYDMNFFGVVSRYTARGSVAFGYVVHNVPTVACSLAEGANLVPGLKLESTIAAIF